jgi:hypothetical protein
MMNNAWKINDGDRTYAKGWKDEGSSPNKNPGQAAQSRGGNSNPVGAGQRVGGAP